MQYKRILFIIVTMTLSYAAMAQDGSSVFNFLRLPFSAHAAAHGGNNISLIEDDLTLAYHNPALLINTTDSHHSSTMIYDLNALKIIDP